MTFLKRLSLLFAALSFACQPADEEPVLVLAAASLQQPLNAIAQDYAEKFPDKPVRFSFAGSRLLQRQIERGAPADIYIPAAASLMDELQRANLIVDDTRCELLRNRIVAVARRASLTPVFDAAELRHVGDRVGVGEPGVPVGDYVRACLTNLGIYDGIRERLVPLPDEPSVLRAVARGAVDWGVVYGSSVARAGEDVEVIADLPRASYPPIVYPAAVVDASNRRRRAAHFLEYLRSPAGRTAFEAAGFAMADEGG